MAGEALIAAYLAASLAVGAAFERKSSSLKGFLVADRSVRDWVLAFTFGATYFSSVVMIVGSSWAYAWGPATLVIPLANIAIGVLLAFTLVGVRVNRLSRRLDALTVPELLAGLHGDRLLQRLVGLATGLGLFLYLTTVIAGASVVAAKALHVGLGEAAAIVGGIIAVYVALGGMYSVVWTDVIQGVIMAGFIAAMLALVASKTSIAALDRVAPLKPADPLAVTDLALLTSVAVLGLPQMVNRFYTVPSSRAVRRATGIAAAFAYIVALGSFIAGLAARELVPGAKPIDAMPSLAAKLMGDVGVAVLAAAVLAASMSTADSVALTAASSLAYDMAGLRNPLLMRLASAAVVFAAAAAAYATLTLPSTVYRAVTTVFKTGWTLAASVTLAPLIFALHGKPSRRAARTAVIVGLALSLAFGLAKALAALGTVTLPATLQPLFKLSFTTTILAALAAYMVSVRLSATPRS